MKKFYTMANIAKSLMLAAFMAAGVTTASAQEGGASAGGSDNKTYKAAEASEYWRGESVETTSAAYIYNVGSKTFITNNTPSVKDIANASVWSITAKNSEYTFTTSAYGIYMESSWGKWTAGVKKADEASKFHLKAGTTTDKGSAYKMYENYIEWFQEKHKLFNIDQSYKYTAGNTESNFNDWLFITTVQKETYDKYVSLYNEAIELLGNEKLADQAVVKETLESALKSKATSSYDKSKDDNKTLQDAIDAAKKAIEDITNGINTINGSAINANVTAIYGINGVRNSKLTKGINIVKMSDGTVKKILVK